MPADLETLRSLVNDITDPHTGCTLGEMNGVRGVALESGRAAVDIRLGYPASGWVDELRQTVARVLRESGDVAETSVDIDWKVGQHAVQHGLAPIPGVRNVVAVASGKGGVGKSTIAVNLALALQAEGARVGVLDADIYGPSVPRMLGLAGQPEPTENKKILPMTSHGLQAMSIGVLVRSDQAMIWRGPMATQALQQMVGDTLWDELDYLIVDLPPGTGDIQLTLAQRIPVAGSVVVTTPQAVALDDVRRAAAMFEKVKVPILGVAENMSSYICPRCGHEEAVFGSGGGDRIAAEIDVPLLGRIPLNAALGRSGDDGTPVVIADPEGEVAGRFRAMARFAAGRLSMEAVNRKVRMPRISITE